jgi:hypothetical protein
VVSQGHIYKRTNPSSALGAFCLSTSIGVNMNTMKSGAGRIETASIHPWRTYARKENNVNS